MNSSNRLKEFPVSFFSIVMELSGLTIAWHKAEQALHWPLSISLYLLIFATTVFVAVGCNPFAINRLQTERETENTSKV